MQSRELIAPVAAFCTSLNGGLVLGLIIKTAAAEEYRILVTSGAIAFLWIAHISTFLMERNFFQMSFGEMVWMGAIPSAATATLLVYGIVGSNEEY